MPCSEKSHHPFHFIIFHFSIFTRILPKKTPPFPFMGLDKYHHPISTITPSLQLGARE